MAATDALKKPQTAYWLWLGDNREKIASMVGKGKVSEVAKKAGEMWKTLPDAAKAPYEKKAKEEKDAYDQFIATDAGKKALEVKKAAASEAKAEKTQKAEEKAEKQAAKEERKNERACKAELKALAQDKDDKLKKPQTAYWIWLGDNRSKIVEMIGNASGAAVGKKGGEMWKALSDAAKAPYEKKAKEQKEAYDKYIASEEGAAALKAFKDAQQNAKDQFKRKADSVDGAEEAPEKAGRKAAKLGA